MRRPREGEPSAADEMRDEDHLQQKQDEAHVPNAHVERLVEEFHVLLELEQTQQPDEAEQPQKADRLQCAKVLCDGAWVAVMAWPVGRGQLDKLEWDRREGVDRKPAEEVPPRDRRRRRLPLAVDEVGRPEREDDVDEKDERQARLESPPKIDRVDTEAHADRHHDGRVEDAH